MRIWIIIIGIILIVSFIAVLLILARASKNRDEHWKKLKKEQVNEDSKKANTPIV